MPNFQENTGFKMPGLGSKEIDSPGNFRDEQHVDKVGYCDTTEDSMLPKGSSPLKARYTSSGYLKDLDAITIPRADKKKCPEGSVEKNGECVPVGGGGGEKPKPEVKTKTETKKLDITAKLLDVKAKELPADQLKTGTDTREITRQDKTKFTDEGTAAYNAKSKKEQEAQDARERLRIKNSKKTVKQERNYRVDKNGKKIYFNDFKDKE